MSLPAGSAVQAQAEGDSAEVAIDVDCLSDGTDDFYPSRKHHRQKSLMKEVRDRIEQLPEIGGLHDKLQSQNKPAHRAATLAAISASLSVPELTARKPAVEPKCQVSFRTALVCTIVVAVLLACLGMFVPLELTRLRLSRETYAASSRQLDLSLVLARVSDNFEDLQGPAERAVSELAASLAHAGACNASLLSNISACVQWSGGGCNVWVPHENCDSLPLRPTAKTAWSSLWEANDTVKLSWVTEVSHSDFSLNAAAVIDLAAVSLACRRSWQSLRRKLSIGFHNSSVFVVERSQGLLVASAHQPPHLKLAIQAPDLSVRASARAVLARFGAWNASALLEEQSFTAKGGRVATRALLGDWLLVAAVPGEWPAAVAEEMVARFDEVWRAAVCVFVMVTLLSTGVALGLGFMISYPLRQLDELMRKLGGFDLSRESVEACLSQRSNIVEVSNLQHSFSHLSRAVEAFARFVPETVVRRIVRGDHRAARLHVSRRDVTIMFSDIRDFTAISEALPECDLLFILTRYLSVMTRIVEYFNGVVAEVLGDGLLVFWNTPDNVEDHAAKGCQAALAQQQAVGFLNAEFARLKLPQLAIRVGLHTGPVLSGNLGSEMKMKFGCLGDPINLASRLEGLCKFYGVGVICSGSTHDALPPEYGLFCRKLDLVQVKGKREATWIYEVVGHEPQAGPYCSGSSTNTVSLLTENRAVLCKASSTAAMDAIHRSTLSLCRTLSSLNSCNAVWPLTSDQPADFVTQEQRSLVELYEKALVAYQEARFADARDLASALLEKHPDDMATGRLLERVGRYLGADGCGVAGLSEADRAAWTGVYVMTDK